MLDSKQAGRWLGSKEAGRWLSRQQVAGDRCPGQQRSKNVQSNLEFKLINYSLSHVINLQGVVK